MTVKEVTPGSCWSVTGADGIEHFVDKAPGGPFLCRKYGDDSGSPYTRAVFKFLKMEQDATPPPGFVTQEEMNARIIAAAKQAASDAVAETIARLQSQK